MSAADPQLAISPSGTLIALCSEGDVEVLRSADARRVFTRRVMELQKGLSAFGFLTDQLLLLQWEDRTILWDMERDMLFFPSLQGRLLLCQEGAALFVEDGRVHCWQLA